MLKMIDYFRDVFRRRRKVASWMFFAAPLYGSIWDFDFSRGPLLVLWTGAARLMLFMEGER